MKPYKKETIADIYQDVVVMSKSYLDKGLYHKAIKYAEAASNWAYGLNLFYTDATIERVVQEVAKKKVRGIVIDRPYENRCVLIDSFCIDNRGLTQQYLRAMMNNGMKILVVHTGKYGDIGRDIKAELKGYKDAAVMTFNSKMEVFDEVNEIVKAIESFSPAHIFLHLTPWDTIALMACSRVKGSIIYNINLTDHAYWMGASFIDYNIEFRPYGYTVSLEKRGLREEQLLPLAYYPIDPVFSEFEGFPPLPEDSIKVFTGGSLYKMLGKNDIFFRMMERILEISPKVFILVAGVSEAGMFEEKISTLRNKDRIVLIGVRHDIDAVFDHSDIYLGTYPMMGGLMSQYAAKHGKPIIAYHEEGDVMNAVEQMVNIHQQQFRSFTDLESMASYAKALVEDEDYREKEGVILQKSAQTSERFDIQFKDLIKERKSIKNWNRDKIDYDSFFNRYLELENTTFGATRTLVKDLKMGVFKTVRMHKLEIVSVMIALITHKIIGKLKYDWSWCQGK